MSTVVRLGTYVPVRGITSYRVLSARAGAEIVGKGGAVVVKRTLHYRWTPWQTGMPSRRVTIRRSVQRIEEAEVAS